MSLWVISYVSDGRTWQYPPMQQWEVAMKIRKLMRKRKHGKPTQIQVKPHTP